VVAALITGMSGAGKTTALQALAARGLATVDTDDGDWIEVVDGEPLWRAASIDALLASRGQSPLFVVGTVANQARWYDRFDAVVLLTAPLDVLLDRLRTRTNNPFGRTAQQRAAVARDVTEVEPRLRASATHVIDTTEPVAVVVDRLLRIIAGAESGRTGPGTRRL
jgi:dephospho-CoA kinase